MKIIERSLRRALTDRVHEDPEFAQRLRERAQSRTAEPDPAAAEESLRSTEHAIDQALGPSADPAMQDALRQFLKGHLTQGER